METFVARQPILDQHQQVYRYELLFRSSWEKILNHDGRRSAGVKRCPKGLDPHPGTRNEGVSGKDFDQVQTIPQIIPVQRHDVTVVGIAANRNCIVTARAIQHGIRLATVKEDGQRVCC